jgi:stage II sporulation protein D
LAVDLQVTETFLPILGCHPEMRRLALLIALCACLAMPGAAAAATKFVIPGRGFGHGVGMSQYGAYGYARHGVDYRRILAHYYTGTDLGAVGQSTVRVLLQSGKSSIAVSGVSQAGSKRLNPAKRYVARVRGAGIELRGPNGRRAARFSGPVRLRGSQGYVLLGGTSANGVTGGTYRGAMVLRPSIGGGVTAVNALKLDSYVRGVVPGEVSAAWPAEALKAQAVAARSYALAADAGGPIFDQYADTRSQLYKGRSFEQPSTTAAVRDTKGEVVLYQGQVAVTYFFSTSGGRTEDVENVFYGTPPSPYLKSVKDPYDGASPRHTWQFRFTRRRLESKLGGLCHGAFRRIKVVKRGVSPRVVTADVVCSRGRERTTGASLRTRLGLYDSWFSVVRASSRQGARPKAADGVFASLLSPRTITGSFDPLPARGYVDVERREGAGWRLVARGLVNRLGAYSVPVYGTGVYRVRAGDVAADPVTIR